VARFGGSFVDYENYLFELRHYVHYYQSQQQDLFGGESQVKNYRKQVLDNIINNAYIKKLAAQNEVSVSNKEIDDRINIVRSQNRLGSNDKVFADVLRDYWGWSVADFKRALKSQILAEKLAAKLDTAAQERAQSALAQINSGTDFGELAKQMSDDANTKANGGSYGFGITKTNPNVPPQVVDALFKLKPNQTSGIIVASPVQAGQPVTLQIVKVLESDGNTVTAQHIAFNLTDVSTYIKELKAKEPPTLYVKF
jgi:parvulin-like peptidyl-prolyl isomerase